MEKNFFQKLKLAQKYFLNSKASDVLITIPSTMLIVCISFWVRGSEV